MDKKSKKYKVIALILALVVLSTSIPLTIWGIGSRKSNAITSDNASSEDKRIASEISNETGVSISEVFEIKSYGRSWNEVLTLLRHKSTLGENGEKNKRDALLLNSGLDEEFVKKLKKEGFSEKAITEVKLIEERVVFQLEEITSRNKANSNHPELPESQASPNSAEQTGLPSAQNKPNGDKPGIDGGNTASEEDIAAYQTLYNKLDIKNAIYFMLKLENVFGGYDKVFDEYLFSLQAELDLNACIKDKAAYMKSRDEKKLLLDERKIITLEKIEEKSIEKSQTEDKENNPISGSSQAADKKSSEAVEKSPLPDVPKPDSGAVKPKNPTDEIMNEIDEINPIKNQK